MENTGEKTAKKNVATSIFLCAILFSLFLSLVGIFIINLSIYSREPIYSVIASEYTESSALQRKPIYIMKESDGKIAIFDADTGNIQKTLDVYIFTLPQRDKEYLKEGILIFSEQELYSLIEDYTG